MEKAAQALLEMKYLGTFQVRARASHQQLGIVFRGGKSSTPGSVRGVDARDKD